MTEQEKREGSATLPPVDKNSPLNELANSLPATTGTGSDNLPPVPADVVGGQYQYDGALPIVAPAAQQPAGVG